MGPSVSSRALDALLDDTESPEAAAINKAVKSGTLHRTALWRYRNGTRKPDAEGVAILDRLSHGKVPANGWEDKPASARHQTKRPKQTAA